MENNGDQWCLSLSPLEPFFKDNPRLEPSGIEPFLMKISPKKGIPTPFPTWGGATIANRPVFTMVLSLF
jgi:hypothetical protein